MRAARTIAMTAALLGGGVFLLYSLQSRYLLFTGKDASYYRQFGAACDSLLRQHPIGTNDWVYYSKGLRSPENSIQLSGEDPSLPKMIRALGPEKVVLSSNKVFVSVGVGRGGFGIIWAQDKGPNGWTLRTCAEGLEKTHYETTKFQLQPGS